MHGTDAKSGVARSLPLGAAVLAKITYGWLSRSWAPETLERRAMETEDEEQDGNSEEENGAIKIKIDQ